MANEINKSEKAKGIMAKLKQLFSEAESTVEHKLADGSLLKADKFEKGGKLVGITVASTYTLTDGTKISCDATGLITEVTPAPIKYADTTFKTTDGKELVITIDDPSVSKLPDVGDKVMMDGKPAPAGSYSLTDGSTITVDATGLISDYTPAAGTSPDMTTPEGMKAAYDKFASGTLSTQDVGTVLKALMEYCFGWQLREAQAKQSTDQAIAVYKNLLDANTAAVATAQAKMVKQEQMLKQVFELMTEVLEVPTGDAPGANGKKKFSFANTESRRKTFDKFKEAGKKLYEEFNKFETAN